MQIYGVQAGAAGPPQYFTSPKTLRIGDYVLVPIEHGSIMGKVSSGPMTALPGTQPEEIPGIIRLATTEDLAIQAENDKIRKDAFDFCRNRIHERKMEMKLVDVDIHFDRSKYIFYFTAPGRIDFRELVKDLVREYRARIELRQIGVRHETQRIGAIGNCGQICCCRRFLKNFAPVTIRMAKEQNLFLNPAKISGICGRLLCCLAHEQENYENFHRAAPRNGKKYQTTKGIVKVSHSNMFKNTVAFLTDNNEENEISMEEWRAMQPKRVGLDDIASDNELVEDNDNCIIDEDDDRAY